MEIRRILQRGWTAIVFLLLLSASAAGQYNQGDSGQYQILQARYGTANHNVDVTEQLKDLARQDRSFRMGNSTFGIDPDHGVVKTLRIYTRGPGGSNRMFEYREGSTVDGSMFTGWGGGNWGHGGYDGGWDGGGSHSGHHGGNTGGSEGDSGQYQILQARYGTANHNVDVTEQLKDLARQDRSFRMGNSTFGIDPDHNVVKTLRIYTRGPGGANRMFEYREGSTVDGSMFTGWGGGNWEQGGYNGGWDGGGGSHNGYNGGKSGENNRDAGVPNGPFNIINATYGAGKHTSDVTSRVRSLISNGRLNITVSNDSLGTDPAPGSHKTLWVTYTNGGRGQQHAQVNEGSRLNIP